MPADGLISRLSSHRLLVVSGKGGVGRTTISAVLGAQLAAKGRRVLIGTTGHDDRLAWMFGRSSLPDVPMEVAPGLSIQRLVPRTCVREYGALITRSRRISTAVFDNRVIRRLLRAIPGLDDFAVLGKIWHEAVRARSCDVAVFDGPASGHLRLVLGVPQTILDTISEGPLADEARAIQDSLTDPATSASILVGLPEEWPLTELAELSRDLRGDIGMRVGALVVNKVWPRGLPEVDPGRVDSELQPVFATVARIAARGRNQAEVVDRWVESPETRGGAEALLEVPWWPRGLEGPDELRALIDSLASSNRAAVG
jgi:anion-transporting  ArsA/GET3 family ATPase